jgi:hypothetical protein
MRSLNFLNPHHARIVISVALLLAIQTLESPAMAQDIDLVGTVKSQDGSPLSDVQIKLVGLGTNLTTRSGEFDIQHIPATKIGQRAEIQAMKAGWHVVSPTDPVIVIPADSTQHPINVTMAPDAPPLEVFLTTISVYYQKNERIGVYVPVGFKSAQVGALVKARLLLARTDRDKIFVDWTGFSDGKEPIGVTATSPVPVGPTSVVERIIQFKWPANARKFRLLPGKYNWTLQLWTRNTLDPSAAVSRTFSVDKSTADSLSNTLSTVALDGEL